MEALAGKRVVHASCGVWHSAAIAAEPLGGAGSGPGPDTSALSWQEGHAIRQKLAAAYELLEQARELARQGLGFASPLASHASVAAAHARIVRRASSCMGRLPCSKLLPCVGPASQLRASLCGHARNGYACVAPTFPASALLEGRGWQLGRLLDVLSTWSVAAAL